MCLGRDVQICNIKKKQLFTFLRSDRREDLCHVCQQQVSLSSVHTTGF